MPPQRLKVKWMEMAIERQNRTKDQMVRHMKEYIESNARLLGCPLQDIRLGTRARNILKRMGCISVRDVLMVDIDTLAEMRNCGIATLRDIAQRLREYGFPRARLEEYIRKMER